MLKTILFVMVVLSSFVEMYAQNWYKGNLHTHSLWSDGDNYPEVVAGFYKTKGYNFLAVTDHDRLQDTIRWARVPATGPQKIMFDRYHTKYGQPWVEFKELGTDSLLVRVKKLEEYRSRFEGDQQFILINGEEISSRYDIFPIHINGINLKHVVHRQKGNSVLDVMQKVTDLIVQQKEETGQNMFAIINHPNFRYALTAEDIMKVKGANFFEVHNAGALDVYNYGSEIHDSVEVMWDKMNLYRVSNKLPLMYGVATDDAHTQVQIGRAWIMVNAPALSTDLIINAMNDGNFYASTGVTLETLDCSSRKIRIRIKPDKGVFYKIQFIGVKRDGDKAVLLKEVEGTKGTYRLSDKEWFVRAKITSSRIKGNPYQPGDMEMAWTQPVAAEQ